VNHREATSPAQSAFSPTLCVAIGSAVAFFVFLVWLLLAAFG
jgi:preprotein translocase subunit Sec61beta